MKKRSRNSGMRAQINLSLSPGCKQWISCSAESLVASEGRWIEASNGQSVKYSLQGTVTGGRGLWASGLPTASGQWVSVSYLAMLWHILAYSIVTVHACECSIGKCWWIWSQTIDMHCSDIQLPLTGFWIENTSKAATMPSKASLGNIRWLRSRQRRSATASGKTFEMNNEDRESWKFILWQLHIIKLR